MRAFAVSAAAGVAAAMLLLAGTAFAGSLTNRDARSHEVTIIEGAASRVLVIEPEQTIKDLCESVCTVQMEDGSSIDVEAEDAVAIYEGDLAYEE